MVCSLRWQLREAADGAPSEQRAHPANSWKTWLGDVRAESWENRTYRVSYRRRLVGISIKFSRKGAEIFPHIFDEMWERCGGKLITDWKPPPRRKQNWSWLCPVLLSLEYISSKFRKKTAPGSNKKLGNLLAIFQLEKARPVFFNILAGFCINSSRSTNVLSSGSVRLFGKIKKLRI